MLILCIVDVERGVGMKNLSQKEAITILEGMRIDIPVPKAAATQIKRNLALDMAINALNCSEFPNNWIPCSEKLPEEGEVVLTQAKFKDDMKMVVSSRIDYNYWTGWGTRDINIIAWMPLPEPYKGEQK
jgi:hypothetical protein